MAVLIKEKFKVYLERSDGSVLAAPAVLEEVTVDTGCLYSDHEVSTKIILRAVGAPQWILGSDFLEHEIVRTEEEWMCTWCGRPNRRENEVCKSCGGARSLL